MDALGGCGDWDLTGERHKETFKGHINILHLECPCIAVKSH